MIRRVIGGLPAWSLAVPFAACRILALTLLHGAVHLVLFAVFVFLALVP